jgi:NADH:ubiquinone reductase (H+-translocating)
LAELLNVDRIKKKITTSIGDFKYDYLVLAFGCTTNYFGNDNIKKHALSLKTTYDAITIRNHVLQNFENIISASEVEKQSFLNLVIIGAGPTGVELAGAFAEIKRNVLPKDYPGIDFSKFRIILIEGAKATLNNLSESSQKESQKYLKRMGVTVRTETLVKDYDGENLTLGNGEIIKTKTVIWAAGVTGNKIEGLSKSVYAPGNRIRVNRINQVQRCVNIFAIGDVAYMETPLYKRGHPQVANVAINQAKLLAKNLKSMNQSKKPVDFEYHDFGSMATVGTNKAVVDFPFVHFRGYIAWLIWMFLHLMLILSVKNKLIIFINWAWAYITKNTSLRLILTESETK